MTTRDFFESTDGTRLYKQTWGTPEKGVIVLLPGFADHLGRHKHLVRALTERGIRRRRLRSQRKWTKWWGQRTRRTLRPIHRRSPRIFTPHLAVQQTHLLARTKPRRTHRAALWSPPPKERIDRRHRSRPFPRDE